MVPGAGREDQVVRRRLIGGRDGQRGDVLTTLIVLPAVLALFYIALHATLVYHASSAVAAAAQDGLYWAQIEGGTEADGVAAATQTLNIAAGLENESIEVDQGEDTVTVRVSADVSTVLVELFNSVSAEVTGPRERFYAEDERQ